MTTSTIRSGLDATVASSTPNRVNSTSGNLTLQASASRAYVWFPTGSLRGRTIASATLTLFARSTVSASTTISAKTVTAGWKAGSLTWANQPAFNNTAIASTTLASLANGTPITLDVTADVARFAAGDMNNGWQIVTSDGSAHTLYSFNNTIAPDWRPTLTVTYSSPPDTPTSLRPHGTVATAQPTFAFDYADLDGDELQGVQVQIATASTFATVEYDSLAVGTTSPEFSLAGATYSLPNAGARYWRVRAQDDTGAWSNWSDPASVTWVDHPTLTLSNPSGSTIGALAPLIGWTFSGTQTAWQVLIHDASTNRLVYDSGVRTNTSTTCQVAPNKLTDEDSYKITVRVKDNVADRITVPGYSPWSVAESVVTFAESASVTAPTSVQANQDSVGPTLHPRVLVAWSRSGAPDWWTIYRDGEPIADMIDPTDTLVSGSAHQWLDHGARAGVTHNYAIRAVVSNASSPQAGSGDVTTHIDGIWLYDPDDSDNTFAFLSGFGIDQLKQADNVTIQSPLGSTKQVRITTGMFGLAGTVSGTLHQVRPGQTVTVDQMEASLMRMKADPTKELRLTCSGLSIPVYVSNLSVSPDVNHVAGNNPRRAVSFDVIQADDLPFKAVL